MSYDCRNATIIDEHGNVALTVFELDQDGNEVSSFAYTYYPTQGVDLDQLVKDWVEQNPDEIAPLPTPTIEELRSQTIANIRAMLTDLVAQVTSNYLPTDPIQWPIKEVEAKAWDAADELDKVPALAPTVWGNFVKAYPDENDTEIKARVEEEMGKILVRAAQFHDLSSFTEALREVSHKAIAAAENEEQLFAIFIDAQNKIRFVAQGVNS